MLKIIGDFIPVEVSRTALIVAVIIMLSLPITFYVLRTIGVYKLSKRAKLKTAFMAFLPLVWIYPAIMLVKETRLFRSTLGKWAIVFVIVFSLANIITFTNQFLMYFPLVGNYFMGREICLVASEAGIAELMEMGFTEYVEGSGIWINLAETAVNGRFIYPFDIYKVNTWLSISNMLTMVLDFALLLIQLVVFFNIFRKYWPQHFILAAVLSVMGLFGVFVFAIRKKQPINYMDYVRSRYANYYGPNGPYGSYGPYGQGPSGPYGYYGGGQTPPNRPAEPFEEYQDPKDKKPEEPFSDFK